VLEKALGEVFGLLATSLHSVWGRVAQTGIAAATVVLEWGKVTEQGHPRDHLLTSTRSAPASSRASRVRVDSTS
jgi:hypothetical protein